MRAVSGSGAVFTFGLSAKGMIEADDKAAQLLPFTPVTCEMTEVPRREDRRREPPLG